MTRDQLAKAKELTKLIDDYKSRIKELETLDEVPGSIINHVQLTIQVKNGSSGNYANQEYGSNNGVPIHLKEKVCEELEDSARRIKRIFEKEIKKLEKEFETI